MVFTMFSRFERIDSFDSNKTSHSDVGRPKDPADEANAKKTDQLLE
jgi:hypothetical protein